MEQYYKIKSFLEFERINFEEFVDLKKKTWIKRGGTTRFWVQPYNIFDFKKFIIWCQIEGIDFEIVGSTSNCYFINDYDPNIVVSTLKLKAIQKRGVEIICDCGFYMTKLARFCIKNGIAGYEGFIGLPGTVGGAVVNNSGCYGSLISDVVKSVIILHKGSEYVLNKDQLKYEHRTSIFKTKELEAVIISVTFKTERRNEAEILRNRAIEYQMHRNTFQEHFYPNLGSIYSEVKFRKLNFPLKCIQYLSNIIINNLVSDKLKRIKIQTRIFLTLRHAGRFRNYVSMHGINCFTWKDEHADIAFKEYLDFMRANSTKALLEIEIKDKF